MKFRLFFYLIFIPFILSAQEKKIFLKAETNTRLQILKAIEEQTGYSIAYPVSGIKSEEKITIRNKQESLGQLLKKTLAGTGYTYRITGYHLLIIQEEPLISPPSTQTIRGRVSHATTGEPIEMATVWLLNGPVPGTLTDSLGEFRLSNLPLGNYTLQFSHIGLSTEWIYDLELTAESEEWCEIFLHDKSYFLKELIIRGQRNQEEQPGTLLMTGGRNIPLEEANRYAGGLNDPARIAATFAGVAAIPGSNAVSIRGNPPQYNQWRLEGIEFYNPSHFADIPFLGGGIYSAWNSQSIGQFNLMTGAFPAEYTNVLGGLFDVSLKQGNINHYQHALQIGLLGVEALSEGPVERDKGSSYRANYRYVTTGMLGKLTDNHNIHSHDLNLKLHLPTRRSGTFTIWGFGLLDQNKTREPSKKPEDRKYSSDREVYQMILAQSAGGISHLWKHDSTSWWKNTLSVGKVYNHPQIFHHPIIPGGNNRKISDLKNQELQVTLQSLFHKRHNRWHTNRSGIRITNSWYKMDFLHSPKPGLDYPAQRIAGEENHSLLLSAHTQSQFRITDYLAASAGITSQYFSLIQKATIEPRLSLHWQTSSGQHIGLAYGLHSRREKMDYYYIQHNSEDEKTPRQKLGFSYAHQLSLNYEYTFLSGIKIRIEPYYQKLFHIPVAPGSSFSIINHESYYLDRSLESTGKGENYGIDLTLQQQLVLGYYYLLSGSLFRSRYLGGDQIWRNSRYDKGFIAGVVGGKEWTFGKKKRHRLGVNARLALQGGDRYSPIDRQTSLLYHDIQCDETQAYMLKHPPSFTGDFGFNYKLTEGRLIHQFSFQLVNMTTRNNEKRWKYNEKNGEIEKHRYNTILPVINYKLYF